MQTSNPEPFSLRLLCVGVDPNFIAYFFSAAELLSLSLDNCITIQEALHRISSISHDAYIINSSFSEDSIKSFVQEIRKKDDKKHMIALIAGAYQEEEYIHILRKDKVIDYVFRKPIDLQEIDNFITDLTKRHETGTPAPASSRLEELKRNYDKTIYDKIELLTKLVESLQLNPNEDSLKNLQSAVHKIGGSAGSYGYGPVSTLCKDLDHQITEILDLKHAPEKQWISSLNEFLKKIKYSFQTSSLKEPQIILAKAAELSLYVIDPDIPFLELLERVKEQFFIKLIVDHDPKTAIDRLQTPDFNPQVVVISETFPNSSLTASDIIDTYRRKSPDAPIIFALILQQDNIDTRIEMMQKGINYIFRKPVSAHTLLKSMKGAFEIESLKNFKVLVLDDDPDFCDFVTLVLSEIGITVHAIYSCEEIFKTLEEYRPQILLLDLILPKYDGLDLLKTLRQDIAYQDLIIIIVTGKDETSTRLAAYAANAEDILYKPLDKAILQQRILSLIDRKTMPKNLLSSQNCTGLFHIQALMSELHNRLANSNSFEQYLALFEIDHFSEWIVQQGRTAVNDLLISISNQLQWEADDRMKCFSYNSSKYALIFTQVDLKVIEIKISQILSPIIEQQKDNICFNCCIVPISKNFGNAQQLLQRAERGVYEAKEQGEGPLRIKVIFPEGEAAPEKKVVLIDPDKELLRILKAAFESRDITVKTYTEGRPALNDLTSCTQENLPALIIAERKLPDMDGLDVFNKLKNRFRNPVPFYFLTVFSSDKDISQGLKEGVLEYISKPFNISILLQKALKTIRKV